MNIAWPAGRREPITLLIAALGGQGGGVLTDWIGHAARAQGLTVQSTSTPGVSQRTGATTYYVEIAAAPEPGSARPVLALTPLPGRVDVVVCAELLEVARMLERGMSTPTRSTLIASTHRVYTTHEKMGGGDRRFDATRITDAARALSRRAVLFDMDTVRARHGAAISAVLFGALSGSGALPLTRSDCEEAIRSAGKSVDASLAAFAEAFELAAGTAGHDGAHAAKPIAHVAGTREAEATPPSELAPRIAALPLPVAEFARLGAAQAAAYQGIGYAEHYLDRVERIVRAEAASGSSAAYDVARETARFLALWMCYEDMIRVAALKSRASRFARIRREVGARRDDVVRVYDFFRPSMLEIAAILPRALGAWLERRALGRQGRGRTGTRVTLQASSFGGAVLLRLIAALRPLRPYSLRYAREQEAIEDWLEAVEEALAADHGAAIGVAVALARLPRLVRGYGETHVSGRAGFHRILNTYRERMHQDLPGAAEGVRAAALALLDNSGRQALDGELPQGAISPRPQPVVWVDRRGA